MTSDEVQALVREQIGSNWAGKNLHDIRVSESLIPPAEVEMVYPTVRNGQRVEHLQTVWLLLEEHADKTGYKLIFDEEDSMFGLAVPGKKGEPSVVVSSFSSFMDAFNGL